MATSRSKSTAADYEYIAAAKLFAHKKNRRFISSDRAKELGLKPPATTQDVLPAQPVTQPAPAAQPAPVAQLEPQPADSNAPLVSAPDTSLFSDGSPPPPKIDAEKSKPEEKPTGTEPPPIQTPPPTPQPSLPTDNRKLATMVWAMIVNLFMGIFGKEMAPRRIEISPGQFFDENEMVVGAWCDYFASIGLKPFSPLANLWLSMAAYLLPRLQIVLNKFKRKKPNQTSNEPQPKSDAAREEEKNKSHQQPQPTPAAQQAQPQQPPVTSQEELSAAGEEFL